MFMNNHIVCLVGFFSGDHKYVVHIFTGGKMTAGTDANVVITLIGDKGSSAEITLDNIDNNFEKNK